MENVKSISTILHRIDDATPDETARAVNELSALVRGCRLRWDLALSDTMPAAVRHRLLRILAMTSSSHQGEVWVALDRATDIVRKAGLTWIGILRPELAEPAAAPPLEAAPAQPERADQSATTPAGTPATQHGIWDGLIYSWRNDPGIAFPLIAPFILFFGMVDAVLSVPDIVAAAFHRIATPLQIRAFDKSNDGGVGADLL